MDTQPAWRTLPVGARVVVRRRLTEEESAAATATGRGSVWSDLIALVQNVDDDGMLLLTDSPRQVEAREVRVPGHLIETAKTIPPKPERRPAQR